MSEAPGSVTIGGRAFTVMNQAAVPFRVDAAQQKILQQLGLLDPSLQPDPEEEPLAYMDRLRRAMVESDQIPLLVGHYLVPLGRTELDWSFALAEQTAAFLEECSAEADRRQIYELAAEFVFGFFLKGARWLETFESFLDLAPLAAGMESSKRRRAAASTSAIGRRWFDRLRALTTIARWSYRAGRSARASSR